jgi:hypothetical protein
MAQKIAAFFLLRYYLLRLIFAQIITLVVTILTALVFMLLPLGEIVRLWSARVGAIPAEEEPRDERTVN